MEAWERLVQRLHLTQTQAVILRDPFNMRYVSGGFTGEGILCITGTRRVIVTDPRYAEQAGLEAPAFETSIVPLGMSPERQAAAILRDAGVEVVRYEDDHVSVRDHARMQQLLGDEAAFLPLNGEIERMRQVKDEQELNSIRQACAVTVRAFEVVCADIRTGMTERTLQALVSRRLYEAGADGTAFDAIVLSGEKTAMCHLRPSARELRRGDVVTLDFGAQVDGWCADMTRTVMLGPPDETLLRAWTAVEQAYEASLACIASGASGWEIDRAARCCIERAGFGERFGHALGHGIGLDVHEGPRLSPTSRDVLEAGCVVTVEPGIYLPGLGGVRIEDTVLVTGSGCEVLTKAPRQLITL